MIVFLPLVMVRLAIVMMEADALLQQNAAARALLRYYRGTWLDDRVSASRHGATGHRDDGGGRPAAARAPLRYYRGTWLDDRVSASHHGATGHRDDGGGRPAAAEHRGEGAAALLPRHVAGWRLSTSDVECPQGRDTDQQHGGGVAQPTEQSHRLQLPQHIPFDRGPEKRAVDDGDDTETGRHRCTTAATMTEVPRS